MLCCHSLNIYLMGFILLPWVFKYATCLWYQPQTHTHTSRLVLPSISVAIATPPVRRSLWCGRAKSAALDQKHSVKEKKTTTSSPRREGSCRENNRFSCESQMDLTWQRNCTIHSTSMCQLWLCKWVTCSGGTAHHHSNPLTTLITSHLCCGISYSGRQGGQH